MKILTFDVAIVGGGIVGISIALSIKQSDPSLRVAVFEKEIDFGIHASGRNSGVLHAGFYYSPDSLKAKFCVDGNLQLRKFTFDNGVNLRKTGKVVVAKNALESKRLDSLYERGLSNGVDVKLLDANELKHYEPLARTFEKFLWSPNTAVSDPKAIMKIMVQKCNQLGIELFSGKQVNVTENLKLFVGDEEIKYRHFVNCAGVNSPGIARKFGLANEYALVPFVGLYNYVPSARIPLRTLVYPVPHEVNPFLGVHFTLTTNNEVKIGPTAIPALGHEQYKVFSKLKLSEVAESFFGLYSITKGDKHSLRQMMVSEIPKIFLKTLVKEAAKLVPSAIEVKEWKTKPPGIRAQLVDKNNGNLVQDFVIESGLDSTHLLNTVSPGWTTSLPFSEYIVRKYVLPNL
jgi:L-2-hydroxyglutarate oxidase LhgO